MFDSFANISYGIVLPLIILFGLPGNLVALCVLHHRFLRSSPVTLLKVLAVHGILTMCFSIYLEIVPTLEMYFNPGYFRIEDEMFLFNHTRESENSSRTELSFDNYNNKMNGSDSRTIYVEYGKLNIHHRNEFTLLGNSTAKSPEENSTLNGSGDGVYDIYEDSFLIIHDKEKEARAMVIKSIQSFISYNLIHIGLLVTLLLTTERCVAVMFPLKAMRWLTASKTRIVALILLLLCIIMHLPQLTKEITLAETCSIANQTDPFHTSSVINPIRRDYQNFVAYSSLVVCVAIFILNMTLLVKLYLIKKKLRKCRHLQSAERNEINVSVAIAVLVFFQLPFHISSSVIIQLSYKFVSDNIEHVTKMAVVSRLLYVAHSALNFVIYCLMAKNCRYVLRLMFKRMSRQSFSFSSQRNEFSAHGSSIRRHIENIPLKENGLQNGRRVSVPMARLKKKHTELSLLARIEREKDPSLRQSV